MKILANLLVVIIVAGCQQGPDNTMENAAVRFSGIFIRDKAPSGPSLRIKESKVVETGTDSTSCKRIGGGV
jgi:hypothetical protein